VLQHCKTDFPNVELNGAGVALLSEVGSTVVAEPFKAEIRKKRKLDLESWFNKLKSY
jgi:hypothetical protein